MLEIVNLSKKYKNNQNFSIVDLSLKVNDGEIFGLLGQNGAGKSTTIKCFTGIITPTSGKILIDGYDLEKQSVKAKRLIGYVPDNHAVYEFFTGREYVFFVGNVYGLKNAEIEKRLDFLLKVFKLGKAIDFQIRSYSHGMKQKICVIASLVQQPKIWVLDEPLVGLDPQSAFELKQFMRYYKRTGNTVIFSSHNIDVVEKVCDRVAIINKSKLVEIVDVKKFKETSSVSLEEYFLNLTKEIN